MKSRSPREDVRAFSIWKLGDGDGQNQTKERFLVRYINLTS